MKNGPICLIISKPSGADVTNKKPINKALVPDHSLIDHFLKGSSVGAKPLSFKIYSKTGIQ
jgi:hypothetical protein